MFKVIFFIAVILLVVFIIILIAVGLCVGIAHLMIYFMPTIELADALVPAAILTTVLIIILGGMLKSLVGNAWAESQSMLSDYYEDEDDEPEPPPVTRIHLNRNNRNRR
jgi:polyferredoxin